MKSSKEVISLQNIIMLKSNLEFKVLVHGSPMKEYYHQGSHYIEGKEKSHFSLRMKNNSSHRVLFVPTVDGLSIMNGKEASFKSNGYIVNSYDSLTIDGWRTSDDKVAQFFFSSPKESYGVKMGKGGNLGVIGCAVFKEKEHIIEKIVEKIVPYPVYPYLPYHPCLLHNSWNTLNSYVGVSGITSLNQTTSYVAATSYPGAINSTPTSAGLGTGFGQDKYSPVVTVDFDKESSPTEVFSIYYNTRENLESLGIEFRKPVYASPSAFPEESGYCKRPD